MYHQNIKTFLQKDLFQHDGVPSHIKRDVRTILHHLCPNSWIGNYGPQHWPTRYPDLTPLVFFLWGLIKHNVVETYVQSLLKLKRRRTTAMRMVNQAIDHRIWLNLEN